MAATPDLQRQALRAKLVAARQALPDRLERAVALQNVLRVWLVSRGETSIGAYWPIKGEFDPLPALYRWSEASGDGDMRRIGLPVADRATGLLRFRVWYPGCEMELDAYDIPKPKDTDEFQPRLLVVPCLGFGPGGVRLGYGGGFFDRTLSALEPRPYTVGVSYTHGFLPFLRSASDFDAFNEAYGGYFPKDGPPRTTVEAAVPREGFLVETFLEIVGKSDRDRADLQQGQVIDQPIIGIGREYSHPHARRDAPAAQDFHRRGAMPAQFLIAAPDRGPVLDGVDGAPAVAEIGDQIAQIQAVFGMV